MKINLFIPPILEIGFRRIKSAIKSSYKIDGHILKIPAFIDLPNIQKKHLLYDRFLPILSKYIDGEKTIIDVGANIGDTTLSIIDKCTNPIICIEPSDIFFEFLKQNIENNQIDQNRITLLKKMIGTGTLKGSLTHSSKGTATLKIESEVPQNTHVPLDSLTINNDVILLKVDTDGYDFDVILSAQNVLKKSEPLIFWENDISEDFQMEGYNKLYEKLESLGYNHVYIFDNYGNLITEELQFSTLRNINSYLYGMKKYNNSRTFYYTDVLACTAKNKSLVGKAVEEYRASWVNTLKK
jgi:FkbM family methyltransferase